MRHTFQVELQSTVEERGAGAIPHRTINPTYACTEAIFQPNLIMNSSLRIERLIQRPFYHRLIQKTSNTDAVLIQVGPSLYNEWHAHTQKPKCDASQRRHLLPTSSQSSRFPLSQWWSLVGVPGLLVINPALLGGDPFACSISKYIGSPPMVVFS